MKIDKWEEDNRLDLAYGTFANATGKTLSYASIADIKEAAKQIAITPVTELDSCLSPVPVVTEITVIVEPMILPYESTDPDKPGMVHALLMRETGSLIVSQQVWGKLKALPVGDAQRGLRSMLHDLGVDL